MLNRYLKKEDFKGKYIIINDSHLCWIN